MKGCGEAGAIGSPPAFINALTDALGVRDIAMPATPSACGAPPTSTRPERLDRHCEGARHVAFEYQRPPIAPRRSRRYSGDARYLAGGQSLIQAMKLRLSSSERLVDLGGIADLKGIKVDAGNVVDRRDDDACGGRELGRREEGDPGARASWPAGIGDPMVRNMGTIGGSIANADPAA